MSKKIQVNLAFSADTSAAKQQIQQLQQQLSNLTTMPMEPKKWNVMRSSLAEATMKVTELKTALHQATNVDTGRLDFGKFQQQLQKSKMTIQDYGRALSKLGPQGEQAFASLIRSIANSETPLLRLQGKIAALGKTLANTARWQISSTMLQAMSSAFSETINYAKELNESLNNIRIVTGKNIDKMSDFAKAANKAAKNLSTSTTEYTNASLIYYQQGLNDQEVAQRTATTVKLANAVGKNAQEVSEWMTAIWNNFDDGSRSMEQYADVLAKLGAATASSADEIAGGLEKFSAVADSVGLSYEYAASALATITAETRQSEDVVGTALKTIFARVENLKLGDTLEDGTNLGQYSAALEKVGVNIKDSNGGLKDMDEILDNIGARWQSLAKDEQVALAQSVAGIRQYNQFIAMMDNYDTMKENVELAKESAGTLELQNTIYAEGMEGTTKRVQANLEEIKNTLVDENDLVPLLNMADGFLTVVGDLLKSIGGLPGLLSLIASIGLKLWGPQVSKAIQGAIDNVKNFWYVASGKAEEDKIKTLTDSLNQYKKMAEKSKSSDQEAKMRVSFITNEVERTKELYAIQGRLTDAEKEKLQLAEQALRIKEDEAVAAAKVADEYARAADNAKNDMEHSGQFEKGVLSTLKKGKYDSTTAMRDDVAKVDESYEKNKDLLTDEQREKYQQKRFSVTVATSDYEEKQEAFEQAEAEYEIAKHKKGADKVSPEELERLKEAKKAAKQKLSESKKIMEQSSKDFAIAAEGIMPIAVDFEGKSQIDELEKAAHYKDDVNRIGTKRYDTSTNLRKDLQTVDTAVDKYRDDIPQELQDKYDAEKAELVKKMDKFDAAETAAAGATDERKQIEEEVKKKGDKATDKDIKRVEDAKKKERELIKVKEDARDVMREQAKSFADTAKQVDIASKAINKNTKNIDANTKEGKDQIENAKNYVKAIEDQLEAEHEAAELEKDAIKMEEEYSKQLHNTANSKMEFGDAVVAVGQGLMSTMSAYQMITGAIDNLSDSIVEGDLSFSTILSTIMSIGMAVPQVISGFGEMGKVIGRFTSATKAADKAQKDSNKTTTIGTALKKLFTKTTKKEGQEVQNTGKKKKKQSQEEQQNDTKSAFAKVAKKFAENPILGAAILVGVVALLGVSVGLSVSAKQDEKNKEQAREEAQARVDELKEEVEKNGEIYASYKENLAIYEETGQGKEKLAEAAKKLAEAYDIEGVALANLSGNYDALTKAANEARVAELNELAAAAEHANALNDEVFEDAMRDGRGHADGSGGYVVEFNDGGLGGKTSQKNNAAVKQAIEEFKKNNKDPELDNLFGTGGAGDVTLSLPDRSSEKFAKAYEAVMSVTKRAREIGDVSSSGIYDEMNSWLAKSQEDYEKYSANREIIIDAQAEAAVISTKSNSGKTVSEINRNDLGDYLTYRENVLGGLDKESDEYKARLKKLGEQENTAYLEDMARAIDDQTQMFADSSDSTHEWLEKQYKSASDVRRRAMAMVEGAGLTPAEYEAAVSANMLKAAVAERLSGAVENGYTEDQSNAIYRVLRAYNQELAKNETLLNMVATDYTKLVTNANKLSSAWNTHSKTIMTATKDSVEYGAAIGALQKDLEEFFEITDSNVNLTAFVHENTDELNDLLSNGNLEAYESLQNKLGEFLVNTTYSDVEGIDKLLTEIGDVSQYAEGEVKTLSKSLLEEVWNNGGTGEHAIKQITEAMGLFVEETDKGLQIMRSADSEALVEWAKKSKDEIDKLIKSIDRFYYEKQKLEDNNNLKSFVSKYRDEAFGRTSQDLSKIHRTLLEDTIAIEQEYLNKAKDLYYDDRDTLLKNWNVELDEQGRIINRADIEKELASTNKELYQQFKTEADAYTESLNTWEQKYRDVINAHNELFNEDLAEINRQIEFNNRIQDSYLVILDYQLKHIEDDAYKAAEALALLQERSEVNLSKFETYKTGITETLGKTFNEEEIARLMQGDGSVLEGKYMSEEQLSQLESYRDGLIELEETLRSTRVEMQENLHNAFNQYNEDIAEASEQLTRYTTVLDNYRNIIEIVGRENLGVTDEIMQTMRKAQVDNSKEILKSSKATMEANKAVLEDAKEQLDAAKQRLKEAEDQGQDTSGFELSVKQWQETVDMTTEQYQTSLEEFEDALSTSLELNAQMFQEHMEDIANSFSKAVGSIYGSLEEMRKSFDRQMEVSEYYLQNFEKVYEINKLNRKINETLEKTDNLTAKSRLVDIQQDLLKMNKEGVKVSQRDIEYMQKKYDLIVAEAALKDAQNAKSMVRLKRDSEGNFGYMYTADEAATDKAKQGYEDALYALQKFSDDTDKELAEMLLATNEKAYEAILGLGDMSTWTMEDWNKNITNMRGMYGEDIGYILEEYRKLLEKNQKSNTQYYAGLVETFNQTYLKGIYPDYNSFVDLQGDLTTKLSEHTETASSSFTTMHQTISKLFGEAGLDGTINNFGKTVSNTAKQVQKDSQMMSSHISSMAGTMVTEITGEGGIVDSIGAWDESWSGIYSDITSQAGTIASAIYKIYENYSLLAGVDLSKLGVNPEGGKKGNGEKTNEDKGGEKLPTDLTAGTVSVNSLTDKNGNRYFSVRYTDKDGKAATGYVNDKSFKTINDEKITDWSGFKFNQDLAYFDVNDVTSGETIVDSYRFTPIDSYVLGENFYIQKSNNEWHQYDKNTAKIAVQQKKGKFLLSDSLGKLTTKEVMSKVIEHVVSRGRQDNLSYNNLYNTDPNRRPSNLMDQDNDKQTNIQIDDLVDHHYYIAGYEPSLERIFIKTTSWGWDGKYISLDNFIKSDELNLQQKPVDFGSGYNYYKLSDIKFDTGGYTGAWGPEGRLAMLHQKEIVLNAHDTENFLAAIGIVRDISDQIEKNAMVMQYQNAMANNRFTLGNVGEILEQNVHITAEFPNATNHSEIEEAFRNLTNLASQYANRKRV